MEDVLQEFKERTQQKAHYNDIDYMRKEEDTDWIVTTAEGRTALWNVETNEYIWENPYYAWRFEIEYESVPMSITEWINNAKGSKNLQKIIQLCKNRIQQLN
tara:strand:- start:507 stop:812 length:306 start_codon:yes stop_codon:yes gene_type:complete